MLLRKFSKRYYFGQITAYFLACCLFFSISPSVALPGPKGKKVGHSNPHSRGAFALTQGRVNPAGITVGTGGARINGAGAMTSQGVHLAGRKVSNTGTLSSPNGYVVMATADRVFLRRPGSNVVVKLHAPYHHVTANEGPVNARGGQVVLAAGDVFSNAISNIDSLSASLTVPDPIGAKGPNPVHGGRHPNKGDGNPGGGNGNGHWGEGNRGNGVGNIWTGNQGRGVGEGMAGGRRLEPPEPPRPNIPTAVFVEAAPLHKEEKFRIGGCPVLMALAAEELGITKDNIQVYLENALANSEDIQACDTSARLVDSAAILRDTEGTGIAALTQVINEFVSTAMPISEEQMASISQTLALYRNADDKPHYAAAGQWLDALVEYVGILNTEIGWPTDESVTFVADKYVAPAIEGGDVSLVMFLQLRLEALSDS